MERCKILRKFVGPTLGAAGALAVLTGCGAPTQAPRPTSTEISQPPLYTGRTVDQLVTDLQNPDRLEQDSQYAYILLTGVRGPDILLSGYTVNPSDAKSPQSYTQHYSIVENGKPVLSLYNIVTTDQDRSVFNNILDYNLYVTVSPSGTVMIHTVGVSGFEPAVTTPSALHRRAQ